MGDVPGEGCGCAVHHLGSWGELSLLSDKISANKGQSCSELMLTAQSLPWGWCCEAEWGHSSTSYWYRQSLHPQGLLSWVL